MSFLQRDLIDYCVIKATGVFGWMELETAPQGGYRPTQPDGRETGLAAKEVASLPIGTEGTALRLWLCLNDRPNSVTEIPCRVAFERVRKVAQLHHGRRE